MAKVVTALIIALCVAYVLTIKNISLNISNNFITDFFRKPIILVTQKANTPTPLSIYATNGRPVETTAALTIKSRKNISIKFFKNNKCVSGPHKIDAEKIAKVELEKGVYEAEIHDGAKIKRTSVSFIGSNGTLEL